MENLYEYKVYFDNFVKFKTQDLSYTMRNQK